MKEEAEDDKPALPRIADIYQKLGISQIGFFARYFRRSTSC